METERLAALKLLSDLEIRLRTRNLRRGTAVTALLWSAGLIIARGGQRRHVRGRVRASLEGVAGGGRFLSGRKGDEMLPAALHWNRSAEIWSAQLKTPSCRFTIETHTKLNGERFVAMMDDRRLGDAPDLAGAQAIAQSVADSFFARSS
jgi:hypothetical protein